jgi:hypothetical protein
LINSVGVSSQLLAGTEKCAIGGGIIVTGCDTELVTEEVSMTVRVTIYVPGEIYICKAFGTVDVLPSPKPHCHTAIEGILTPVGVNRVGLLRQLSVHVKSTCALTGFAAIKITATISAKMIDNKFRFFIT